MLWNFMPSFGVAKCWRSDSNLNVTMFNIVAILVIQLLGLSSSFRVELEMSPRSTLFHIETEANQCGCEELRSLDGLKSKEWKPEDFLTHHGKLWLGGVKALEQRDCAKLCLLIDRRTSHFTFEGESMCHCYSDLHPFHCEEEEGVDLVAVHCIAHKKVPNSRPLLTMLTRSSSSATPRSNSSKNQEQPTSQLQFEQKTTLAAASGVLILMALIGLICLMGKTFHEEKRKKKTSVSSLASSTTSLAP